LKQRTNGRRFAFSGLLACSDVQPYGRGRPPGIFVRECERQRSCARVIVGVGWEQRAAASKRAGRGWVELPDCHPLVEHV